MLAGEREIVYNYEHGRRLKPSGNKQAKEMESLSVYSVDKIRNVCVMGHGGEGKTSLVESMLYMTKATDRMGKIADGNTVCDYDPEEIRRKFSISISRPHQYRFACP